ncbi:MAG: hypothetical protein IH892_04680 [Planctomycetes bacterium]|nr:hypothetical protein [Planctomycetota bacterium]
MFVQLISAKTLFNIIEERRSMPDFYRLKSVDKWTVCLTRDNASGLEAPLRYVSCGHGMSYRGLNYLATKVGWMLVTVPA